MPRFINVSLTEDQIGPMIKACRNGALVLQIEFGVDWDANWLEDLANTLEFYQALACEENDNG